jgi:uncharacterized protein (DUF1015 family)
MSDALIKPFRGLLYNKKKVEDAATFVCPPFDVISDPEPYYERSPFNAVRLELPLPAEGADAYDAAARTLDTWLSGQILSLDGRETIYTYEQEFTLQGRTRRRRGIIPLVRLDRQRIFTHEETRKEAREDRERLARRLKTFTSLVFAMYEDPSGEIEGLVEGARKEEIYDFVDDLSLRNRFSRMTDASEMAGLAAAMGARHLYIADGHHRLSVAFKLGLSHVPVYLTDMHAEGIAILPYHRAVLLKEKRGREEIISALEPYFTLSGAALSSEAGLNELVDACSSSPTLSFLLYFNGKKPSLSMLTQKKALLFDPGSPEIMRRLKVNAIHRGVLTHLLGVKDEEISFLNSPEEARRLVNEGRYDFALFVPATSVEEVKAIAENGLFMPPKSTYFYPKILTGLVFYKYG